LPSAFQTRADPSSTREVPFLRQRTTHADVVTTSVAAVIGDKDVAMDFAKELLGPTNLLPHGFCLLWDTNLVWLHMVSDGIITLAYYSIPFGLVYFVRRRQDLAFHWIFLLFGIFIFACGTTHVMNIWTLWQPLYVLEGGIKLLTASASIATAIILVPLIPKALALPSPSQLTATNQTLLQQIHERERVEALLQRSNAELERRVQERTADLATTIAALQNEIAERLRAEDEVRQLNAELEQRISERTAQLQMSETRFRGLLESAPDAMVITSSDGRIVLVNRQAEEMFGYQRHELLDHAVEMLMPERLRDAHLKHRAAYTQDLQTRSMGRGLELYGRRKDGSEFPVEISLSPLVTDEGVVVSSAIRDVTERKQTEDALKQSCGDLARSNAELEQFAYVASHDLQEPLRAVSGCVQLLQQHYQSQLDARAEELMAHAVDGTSRMQTLIHDLLAYARVTTRGRELEPTDCEAILKEALNNLATAIQESGAVVTHGALPTVAADPTQLLQVFQNLLSNAIKYRGVRPPEVHIDVEHRAREWQFAVRDNGIGIEPQYFERIFGIFQRLHTRKEYPGTGIGLALCRKIIERHGGRIWVASQPGEGSTFFFTISDRR
jgi:PAS domain S-box-containing protein